MSDKIIHTSDDGFEGDVLRSDVPVLLDFWAEWCGPCKAIAPALDQLADEFDGRVRIVKLNIDENPATPPKYQVRGIPTLMLFKDGVVQAQTVGSKSKPELKEFLEENI